MAALPLLAAFGLTNEDAEVLTDLTDELEGRSLGFAMELHARAVMALAKVLAAEDWCALMGLNEDEQRSLEGSRRKVDECNY